MRSAAVALSAFAAVFAVPALPAEAPLVSGDTLHAKCSAAETETTYAQDVMLCRAYIMGVYDDFMTARVTEEKPSCAPEGATAEQVVDTILEHMRDQPAFNDGSASDLVRISIIGAWPACSEVTR